MAFIKHKRLFVRADSGYEPFLVDNEFFLTADLADVINANNSNFSYEEYVAAIKYPLSIRVCRVYLLNDDESIFKDISEYVISGNLSFKFAKGQTRSGNLTLFNHSKIFNPHPINGLLWDGKKLRVDMGLYFNRTVYWKKCGIYLMKNPEINIEDETISIQIYDKYAGLDGTVGGKRANVFKISVGTNVKQAIQLCLSETNYNGKCYDNKSIIFPSIYNSEVTPYTINKTAGNMGEIPIELAKMISCDIQYNDTGNLTISRDSDDVNMDYAPIAWFFKNNDLTCISPTLSYDYSDVPNIVFVTGAIENGKQYKGSFTNKNPRSKNNIMVSPPNVLSIDDSNIIGDKLCEDRAKYEYSAASRANLKLSFQSVFIPHLMPNDIFIWDNEQQNIKNEKFVISDISYNLVDDSPMNISAANLNEVTTYGL